MDEAEARDGTVNEVRAANLHPIQGNKLGLATLPDPPSSKREANAAPSVPGLEELVVRELAKHLGGIKNDLNRRPRRFKAPVKHTSERILAAPRILLKAVSSVMPLSISLKTIPCDFRVY